MLSSIRSSDLSSLFELRESPFINHSLNEKAVADEQNGVVQQGGSISEQKNTVKPLVDMKSIPSPISEGLYFLSSHASKLTRDKFELLKDPLLFPHLSWQVGYSQHSHGFAYNAHFALYYASNLPELEGLRYAVVCTRLDDAYGDDFERWQRHLSALRYNVVVPPKRIPTLFFTIIVLGVEPRASFIAG